MTGRPPPDPSRGSASDPVPVWSDARGVVWEELERPGPDAVSIGGTEVRAGSRVLLRPRERGDVLDIALVGKVGVIEGIEQDLDDNIQLAVCIEDDPGRDLGERRQPGHRFFFTPEEVEPIADGQAEAGADPRILVAGIGNVFLGDDGFGVEAAARVARRELPAGVAVVDFGVRGMDLAYALGEGWDAVIMVDAVPRGERPGTLFVIEAELGDADVVPEAHGMDPVKVLALARELGPVPERVLVVGCEPETRMSVEDEELLMELSETVRGSIDEAVRLVESLIDELRQADERREDGEG